MKAASKLKQLNAPKMVKLDEDSARFLGAISLPVEDFEQWDMERQFLAQVFLAMAQEQRDHVLMISGVISPDSFVYEQHSAMWAEFLNWQQSGEDWNLPDLVDCAWSDGGMLYCSRVLDCWAQVPALLKQTMAWLYEQQRHRDHAKVISEHEKRKSSGKYRAEELQAQLTAALREWEEANLLTETSSLADDLLAMMEDLEAVMSSDVPLCSKTGIVELDDVITGLIPADYMILAGRPGSGKTSLVCNIAENVCARGGAVVFFSLEMTRKQLLARLMQQMAGVPADWFLTGDKRIERFIPQISKSMNLLATWNLKIYDHAGLKEVDCCPALLEQARVQMGVEKIDLCIFDHLGEATKGATDKQAETTRKSGILRDMAKHTEVPTIALVQMNRGIEKDGRDEDGKLKRLPMVSDLRDAGELEEQASKILFTHNKEQLVLRKNRFGQAEAEIGCAFVGCRTRWGTR